jgi:pyruvate dehydrogenase kinase 2/3/4
VDPASEEIFAKVIESIYERHSSTLITMAKGAHELRTIMNHDVAAFADSSDVQKRLDEFYMSRIGIRMVSGSRLFFCSSPLISARLPGFHTRS